MSDSGSLNRLVAGERCLTGMPLLFRNEYAIEQLKHSDEAWLSRLLAWIAPARDENPSSLVNFERVMRGTRTLAR